MQITIIKLLGYREWTESLGHDREHIIQSVQGVLHSKIVELFAKHGAIAHPLRYDLMLAVTNGMDLEAHLEVLKGLEKYSPVPVVMSVATGRTALHAEMEASQALHHRCVGAPVIVSGQIPDLTEVCIVHADLRGSSELLSTCSVYRSYLLIDSLVRKFRRIVTKMHGITLYLGGDNMIGVTTPDMLDMELLLSFSRRYNIRIGIGIDVLPRQAMSKATQALDELRCQGKVGVLAVT